MRNRLHDGFKQRLQVLAGLVDVGGRRARLRVGVQHGKIDLVFARVEIDEQVIDLVQHFLRARVGPVDLVDDQDRRQLGFQRLAQHVARLRQRTFAGIDQQHHAVHHLERALHFAAEIAVAGGIDDVDLDVVIKNRGVLGQNRDAALALQFIRVHDPLGVCFVGAPGAALVQHGIHQSGLAVVHVRDDGDIA